MQAAGIRYAVSTWRVCPSLLVLNSLPNNTPMLLVALIHDGSMTYSFLGLGPSTIFSRDVVRHQADSSRFAWIIHLEIEQAKEVEFTVSWMVW